LRDGSGWYNVVKCSADWAVQIEVSQIDLQPSQEDPAMKIRLQIVLYLLVAAALTAGAIGSDKRSPKSDSRDIVTAFDDAVAAQPKLLRITCRMDGSGRIIFTRQSVHYEHKHWRRPNHILFDGEPWTKLDQTPVPWRDFGDRLDLTRAWIVKRKGRDVIALEHTPDGFDLYLCDSPNGGASYDVTLAIPRRR